MTQDEIIQELEAIAARWRNAPHLSTNYKEGEAASDLCDELLARFGIRARIDAVDEPTNYRVRIGP